MRTQLIKFVVSTLETSMRSPSGWSGWITRGLMRTANPRSTQVGIQRLGLREEDVFCELGAGEGAGLQTISRDLVKSKPPSRIHLVEISEQFRGVLNNMVENELPSDLRDKVSVHGNDCQDMPFLEDDSVDKMFAMNVVYFLNPLPLYLKEFHRVLKPGGCLVFGCKFGGVLPKDSSVFVNVEEEKVAKAMSEAGFEVTSEFVEVSKEQPNQNYIELKGVKKG